MQFIYFFPNNYDYFVIIIMFEIYVSRNIIKIIITIFLLTQPVLISCKNKILSNLKIFKEKDVFRYFFMTIK